MESIDDLKFGYNKPNYDAPIFKKTKNCKYIPYGNKESYINRYPDYIIYLYNNGNMHKSIVDSIVHYIVGKGFILEDENSEKSEETKLFLDNINIKGDSADDLLKRTALDYKLYGSFAWNITWSKDWTTIKSIEYVDCSKIRVSEVDNTGEIPGYYFSFDWSCYKPKFTYIPTFSPKQAFYNSVKFKNILDSNNLEGIENNSKLPRNQLFYYKDANPGSFYYPLPDYQAGINTIMTEIETDIYGISTMQNGLSADFHINITGVSGEEAKKKEFATIKKMCTGRRRAGMPAVTFSTDASTAPVITKLETNGEDKIYTSINSNVQQKILFAHRVTNPELVGLQVPGKLGNKDELSNSFELFYRSVIKPKQSAIVASFNKILKIMNLSTVTIDRIDPIDVKDLSNVDTEQV